MGWPRLDGIARTNAILAQVRTEHIPLKLAKLPSECDSAIATSSLSPGATPKEPFPNHFIIKLIPSVRFPENAPSPVGFKPTISP